MIPFRSSAGTGPQDTLILVDVTSLIVTSCGGLLGSENKEIHRKIYLVDELFTGSKLRRERLKGIAF